jgi:hypothetical protein
LGFVCSPVYLWTLFQFGSYVLVVFNQLVGEKPTDLRMQMPPPTTNFDGLPVSLAENQRQAAVQAP